MPITDYFRPVPSLSAEEVRRFVESHGPGEFNLVDVRQPSEFEAGHLPGARLIPVAALEERAAELDPDKPTFLY